MIEGRFFSSQAHNSIDESSSVPVRISEITIDTETQLTRICEFADAAS